MLRAAKIYVALVMAALALLTMFLMTGAGAWQRRLTLSGIYAVCQPSGYAAVCFVDKAGGGMSCLPLSQIGGNCK
jgi:hypothetical protein